MCCEFCPKYEDCAVNETTKNKCCKICPDHGACSDNNEGDLEELYD